MLLYLQTWAFQSYNVYLLLQMPVGVFNVLILEVLCILLPIISVRITHTYFTVHDIGHSYFLIVYQEIPLIYFGCKIYCGDLVAYGQTTVPSLNLIFMIKLIFFHILTGSCQRCYLASPDHIVSFQKNTIVFCCFCLLVRYKF